MSVPTQAELRIMMVEGSDSFFIQAEKSLSDAGFIAPVIRYNSGTAALEYLWTVDAGKAPHVILVDLETPHGDGLEVLKWLRSNYCQPEVPIYILTDNSLNRLSEALDAGANGFYRKSGELGALIEQLNQLTTLYYLQRRRRLRKMSKSLGELALMSDYDPHMIIITDIEGRVKWVNDAFVRVCGYSLEEVVGIKPGALLQGPATDLAVVAKIREALVNKTEFDGQIINYRKDGSLYNVTMSLGPVMENGRCEGFLAIEAEMEQRHEVGSKPAESKGTNYVRETAAIAKSETHSYGPIPGSGF